MSEDVIYIAQVPTIEIRDGLVFVSSENGEWVWKISDFRRFVGRGQAAVAINDRLPDNVIPLCELCVRHKLPRVADDH